MSNVKLIAAASVLTAAVGALTASGDTASAESLQASIDAGKVLKPQKPKVEGKATFISVPKDQKDVAKGMGAKWMGLRASWYVPAGTDPQPFVDAGFPVVDLPPRVAKKEG